VYSATDLHSRVVALNGAPVTVPRYGTLPTLSPATATTNLARVTMVPTTIAFLVFPEAAAAACAP
jgi:hypothetical protein